MDDSNTDTAAQGNSCIQDSILLEVLALVEELYTLQSELGNSLRTGYLWLAKSRKGMKRVDHVSALDAKRFLQARCRVYSRPMRPEEVFLPAKELVEKLNFSLSAWSLQRTPRDDKTGKNTAAYEHDRKADNRRLRLRSGNVEGDGSDVLVAARHEKEASYRQQFDDMHLSSGFVPQPIRKARRMFSAALDISLRAAQIIQRILVLLHLIGVCVIDG